MDKLITLLEEYRMPGADRIWIIRQLEQISDPRVTEFLLALLSDKDEKDFNQVEALRALSLYHYSSDEQRSQISGRLVGLGESTEDEIVFNHLLMSLGAFVDFQEVVDFLEKVALDEQMDIDARYNALNSLEEGQNQACLNAKRRIEQKTNL